MNECAWWVEGMSVYDDWSSVYDDWMSVYDEWMCVYDEWMSVYVVGWKIIDKDNVYQFVFILFISLLER